MRFCPPNPNDAFATIMVYAGSQTDSDALLLVCKNFLNDRDTDNSFRLCTTLSTSHKDNKP